MESSLMPKSRYRLMARACASLLLLACGSHAVAAGAARDRDDWIRPLEASLERAQETHDLSGVVVVARGEKVLLRRAYGWADRAWAVPARPDHRFNLASMN